MSSRAPEGHRAWSGKMTARLAAQRARVPTGCTPPGPIVGLPVSGLRMGPSHSVSNPKTPLHPLRNSLHSRGHCKQHITIKLDVS